MAVVTVWNEELPLAPFGEWTVDDLARLPDDGRQHETADVGEPFAVSVCPAQITRPGAGGS